MATGTDPKANDGGLAAALGDGATPPADPKPTDPTPPKAQDKSAAPEAYTPWTTPEGYELDPKLVEQATPIFKELGLTQEQTQKLVDIWNEHSVAAAKEGQKIFDEWMDIRKGWREGMLSDEVLGKLVGPDGKHGPDSPLVQTMNRALAGLQNPKLVADFKDAMDLTGAGDNPAFVRVFHALASKVTEGTSYAAGGPVAQPKGQPKSAAAALYPNLPSASGGS